MKFVGANKVAVQPFASQHPLSVKLRGPESDETRSLLFHLENMSGKTPHYFFAYESHAIAPEHRTQEYTYPC